MYTPTIGLEIHSQLKTRTKMFCGCKNDPAASDTGRASPDGREEKRPNINVCPICLAHPGALPTINEEAVKAVLRLGMAIGATLATESKFDRKNYFYPDLPKGYQISQYDKPLVQGGNVCGVRITRVHLEEDTGRIQHENAASSLIDFNRASVPLMELVTEPDIKSGEQAVAFAKELQLILRYLGISDADMERGQMRVEVNISMGKEGARGTKVEIKNLNSFRAVGEATDYEIKRQTELLEKGEAVVQETRGWDDGKKITKSQRLKESSHDYRYFPEPDLPPLDIRKFDLEELRASMPELPEAKRERFRKEFKLSQDQVETLVGDPSLAKYFEEAASELAAEHPASNTQLLYNYLTSDLVGLVNKAGIPFKSVKISPENLAELVAKIEKGELSSRMAKDVLALMFESGRDPDDIIEEKGMVQVNDEDSLRVAIESVISENPEAVADYKKGKGNAVQFLVGQTMAKLRGKGNPQAIFTLIGEELTKLK